MFQSKTMPVGRQAKQCQNCKTDFTIEPEDFEFYQKISVPEPTFCPMCRAQRRLAFRSGRNLYKTKVENCDQEVFSCIHPDSSFKVYHADYWWSDKMDAMQYGRDYDFSRPFFEQFKELMFDVGMPHKFELEVVDSPYTNNAGYIKNCYLVFNVGTSENCAYGVEINYSKDCYDNSGIAKCELCYEGFMLAGCYKAYFSSNCADCQEIYFCSNCVNCQNCFGCVNLKHKQYHIFNQPRSRQEYFKKLEELNLGSYESIVNLNRKARDFWLKYPVKYMHGRHNVNVVGEDIYNSKNVFESYGIKDGEEMKYCQLITFWPSKDCYDITVAGGELCYEIEESAGYRERFSWLDRPKNTKDHQAGFYEMEYTGGNSNSSNLFGCVGLRNKSYCILNKQYSEESFGDLRAKIIQHMNEMPYIDKNGRIYKYGEFFPAEFSPFAYNETMASEYFPLTKKQAEEQGFLWREKPKTEYRPTIKAQDLPDHIKDAKLSILKEVIQCFNQDCQGSGVFRLISDELKFYQKQGLPLPRLCPDCRYWEITKQRLPMMKLYKRRCMNKPCPNEFETAYAPDWPEIVYCESCYQKEVN